MGVYIKNMEMPTDASMIFAIRPDGMVEDVMGCYVGKAIPVPPHGRLIDADKLEYEEAYLNGHYELGDVEIVTRKDIESAPTIIPAEEGE